MDGCQPRHRHYHQHYDGGGGGDDKGNNTYLGKGGQWREWQRDRDEKRTSEMLGKPGTAADDNSAPGRNLNTGAGRGVAASTSRVRPSPATRTISTTTTATTSAVAAAAAAAAGNASTARATSSNKRTQADATAASGSNSSKASATLSASATGTTGITAVTWATPKKNPDARLSVASNISANSIARGGSGGSVGEGGTAGLVGRVGAREGSSVPAAGTSNRRYQAASSSNTNTRTIANTYTDAPVNSNGNTNNYLFVSKARPPLQNPQKNQKNKQIDTLSSPSTKPSSDTSAGPTPRPRSTSIIVKPPGTTARTTTTNGPQQSLKTFSTTSYRSSSAPQPQQRRSVPVRQSSLRSSVSAFSQGSVSTSTSKVSEARRPLSSKSTTQRQEQKPKQSQHASLVARRAQEPSVSSRIDIVVNRPNQALTSAKPTSATMPAQPMNGPRPLLPSLAAPTSSSSRSATMNKKGKPPLTPKMATKSTTPTIPSAPSTGGSSQISTTTPMAARRTQRATTASSGTNTPITAANVAYATTAQGDSHVRPDDETPLYLNANVTPRSGTRQHRVDSASSTPNTTPNLADGWDRDRDRDRDRDGRSPKERAYTPSPACNDDGSRRPLALASIPSDLTNQFLSQPLRSDGRSKSDSKFFYASDAKAASSQSLSQLSSQSQPQLLSQSQSQSQSQFQSRPYTGIVRQPTLSSTASTTSTTRPAPPRQLPPKASAQFFYASANAHSGPSSKANSPAPLSPTLSQLPKQQQQPPPQPPQQPQHYQDGISPKFVYANGTPELGPSPSFPIPISRPSSVVSTSSRAPTSKPPTSVYLPPRPSSPAKQSHTSSSTSAKSTSVKYGANLPPQMATNRASVTSSPQFVPSPSLTRRSSTTTSRGAHSRTGSQVISDLGSGLRSPLIPSEASSPSFVPAPRPPPLTLASIVQAAADLAEEDEGEDDQEGDQEDDEEDEKDHDSDLGSDSDGDKHGHSNNHQHYPDESYDAQSEGHDLHDLYDLQSPTKSTHSAGPIDSLVTSARRERKVQDLEITNASLEAINRSLERQLRKQTAELRRYQRLSRSGRLSATSTNLSEQAEKRDSVAPTLSDLAEETSAHEGDQDRELLDDAEDANDDEIPEDSFLDSDSVVSDSVSPSVLLEKETKQRKQDQKRLQLDLSRHQELLVCSQQVNNSIKRCLDWTEELIKEGKKALDYTVRLSDSDDKMVRPRVLRRDDDDDLVRRSGALNPRSSMDGGARLHNDGDWDGDNDNMKELEEDLGTLDPPPKIETWGGEAQDRDSGIDLAVDGG